LEVLIHVKLSSKYILGEGEGGVSRFFLRLQSYYYGNLPLGCTDSGGYVKFTPKYIIVVGERGYQNLFKDSNHILLVTQDHMLQSFKIVAYLLLCCTDSGGYVNFTPKYIIVGDERGYQNLFKDSNHILLVTQDHMQSFKIVAYLLLGCTDSGGYVKFTPKYIIVGLGVKGGIRILFKVPIIFFR
jgi:hypothetical protein